jgi:hypothetical protein
MHKMSDFDKLLKYFYKMVKYFAIGFKLRSGI